METPRERYESKNERKCSEPKRERMNTDLMDLDYTELNHIYFGNKTDSEDVSRNSDEGFVS